MTVPEGTVQAPGTSQMWDVIAERMEAFAGAWEGAAAPPSPADYLPAEPIQLRSLLLVELIKIDLDARLQRGLDRGLEHYAREFPGMSLPADLLYEDYHLRRRAGQLVEPQDYFNRFPERAEELARLLGVSAGGSSTSIAKARKTIALQAGDQIDDFDLLTLLGEGQFAKVFLARQRSMQRLVALKVSAAQGAEAQTLAQLEHPHIVRVFDQRLISDRGLQLVYMAYLPGGTLQDVLVHARKVTPAQCSGSTLLHVIDAVLSRRGETPPQASPVRREWAEFDWPSTVCAVGARLAAALDYSHRRGVLHRDVKPANVLLTAEGEPMLADFNVGCCTKLDGAGPAALFGGSLAYMALEHIEAFDPGHSRAADSLDGRADIFGLAVTLWELATGSRPFGPDPIRSEWKETLAALAEQRKAGPAAGSSAFPEGQAHGLREVLLSCLEADRDRRPRTAGDLARELHLCLRPATRDLIRPAPGGWKGFIQRHPLLAIYPLAVIPNLLASLFNIAYNRHEIIDNWPNASTVYNQIILAVNGIFFPLGMFIFWLLFRPVARGLLGSTQADPADPLELARMRQRCLRLGAIVALVCVLCWSVAGLLWPIILRMAVGPPSESQIYIHLLISLVFCGLIAAAYPYFLVTYLSVAVLYPVLLKRGEFGPGDRAALHQIEREIGRYRAAATAVPLLAVALLASRGASNQIAVAVLSAAGLAGVALAFLLEGRTLKALAALADMPSE